jgi:hypothetical protein
MQVSNGTKNNDNNGTKNNNNFSIILILKFMINALNIVQ